MATKRSAVDKLMELERFREERQLVREEMKNYLSYYTERKLPSLQKAKAELKSIIQGIHAFAVLNINENKM